VNLVQFLPVFFQSLTAAKPLTRRPGLDSIYHPLWPATRYDTIKMIWYESTKSLIHISEQYLGGKDWFNWFRGIVLQNHFSYRVSQREREQNGYFYFKKRSHASTYQKKPSSIVKQTSKFQGSKQFNISWLINYACRWPIKSIWWTIT